MGNLVNTLKKFLSNKNTVTILGVLAGVIVLWGFYSYRVNKAVNPVRVPYANKALSAQDQITQDDISYMEVSSDMLKTAKVITNASQLVGYYVNVGTSIPEGGMFYQTQVVEKKELPDSIFDEIPDGYTIYQLKVNNDLTYGNSIYPGNRIDLYMKATENGRIIYGKLIESIEVLAVRDSSGQNVFDESSGRTPALLLFAVPEELSYLLRASEYVSEATIYPIPRNRNYTAEAGETIVGNEELVQYLEARVISYD